jgi:hypothetical protein
MKTSQPGFFKLYFRMFAWPSQTFDVILSSEKRLKYGFFAFLVPSLGYTLFYIMAYFAGGSPSTFKPWLALPIEEYFKYDIYLTFPGYYLSWISASGTVFLISRLMGGKGKYIDTLVVIAFGLGVATWSSLLHDLTDAFLSVIGVISMKEYERLLNEPTFWRHLLLTLYAIYFTWFITLFTIGIKKAYQFNWLKALVLALIGLVVFQGVLLIFIR